MQKASTSRSSIRDNIKYIKQKEVIITWVEIVSYKLEKRTTIE